MTRHLFVLLLAIVFDRLIGDPDIIWRRVPHPVVLFGKAISYLDKELNRKEWSNKERFYAGWGATLLLLLIAAGCGLFIHIICLKFGILGVLIEAIIASVFLAQKSLNRHVNAVFDAFCNGGLTEARKAVSLIVGRDPEMLNKNDVSAAAIESLAENASDGVVAPVFWFLLLGLPGIFIYKMLNTADSMIGHLNEQYRDFGYAAAKLDDAANYIPARLTAFFVLAAVWMKRGKKAAEECWIIIQQNARNHRSPNAGWPESAFAGALNLRLAGPRFYNGKEEKEPYLNANGQCPVQLDIPRALIFYNATMNIMTAIVAVFLVVAFLLSFL